MRGTYWWARVQSAYRLQCRKGPHTRSFKSWSIWILHNNWWIPGRNTVAIRTLRVDAKCYSLSFVTCPAKPLLPFILTIPGFVNIFFAVRFTRGVSKYNLSLSLSPPHPPCNTDSYSRNYPHFTEPDGSLPHSQDPATYPYPEPGDEWSEPIGEKGTIGLQAALPKGPHTRTFSIW